MQIFAGIQRLNAGCTILMVFFWVMYFQVKMVLQYMRRIIQKRAKFDIMDLNVLKVYFLKH
jgi:hypothetical protein